MNTLNKKAIADSPAKVGLFSKREAALLISSGYSHVHSSLLGLRDSLANLTLSALASDFIPSYTWEANSNQQQIAVHSSKERKKVIDQVLSELKIKSSSSMGDKIWTSLEELLTNSIFHAYQDASGKEKYHRRETVELLPEEKILLGFSRDSKGIYVSVQDSGVGLTFSNVQSNFKRCYESQGLSQIETKDGGAGLGLYVVFELATHVKITSRPNSGTLTQCWFSNSSNFDPDYFSFNFFTGATKS
ncbi:MAG: ATP-binding protein [Proteobacteria bacterium]|nr:ATP-binding protein [Pseudomonadota bacterium]